MKLGQLGEFGLLDLLKVSEVALPASWIGPGDDAALFPLPTGQAVVTTDLLAEDVHFRRETISAEDLGYKALAVNLSDLAAMGARPVAFTLAAALPGHIEVNWVKGLYRGLTQCAARFGCPLVGGDTSSADQVFLSITAIGEAPPTGPLLRSTAQPGDELYVSGTPGESGCGLRLLEGESPLDSHGEEMVARHRRPKPRMELGLTLAAQEIASSMIDLSDGLLQDARHISETSQVQLEIFTHQLPLSSSLQAVCRAQGWSPLALALGGGEDYELLFTAPVHARAAVMAASKSCDLAVTRIGEISEGDATLRLLDERGQPYTNPEREGFDHFR